LLLTNRNHFRASMRVKERTGARIAIHPKDAAFAAEKGTAVDDELRVGERVGPFAVSMPHGKSAGEIALHWARGASCSSATRAWESRRASARPSRRRHR